MRIQVINGGPLGGWLTREGYEVTNRDPDYTIECVPTDYSHIAISTGNIELENLLIEKLRELGEKTFLIDKTPPISDRKLTIKVPADNRCDVERGIFRAFVMYILKNSVIIPPTEPKPEVPLVPWWKRLFPLQLSLLLSLFTLPVHSQDGMTFIQLWTSSGPVYAADFTNNAMRVNCIVGCGGGGGGGTSSVFGAAFPTDGTAVGFRDASGNMSFGQLDAGGRLTVTGAGGTFPVTGTFFQATQPVSSTQFPAALVGGRFDTNIGAWLGSVAPTIGQKTSANSIPTVLSSDQPAIPVTASLNAGTANIGDVDVATVSAVNNDGAQVALTSTSSTVLASFATRRFASICSFISNTDIIFLKFAATATTADFRLEVGQCFNMPPAGYTGIIDGRSNAGTQTVSVVEW